MRELASLPTFWCRVVTSPGAWRVLRDLLFASVLLWSAVLPAQAQTASVGALIDQSCTGTRAGKNLGCTANDLTASISFTQPTATAITSCIAGQYITLDAIASLTSGSPNRYNIGLFTGQVGNDPTRNNAADQCSLGIFPTTPTPFSNFDGGAACGDFAGSSTATLQITALKVTCLPAPGTNQLGIPYVLAWDNSADASCTAASLTASTNSKCNVGLASYVTGVFVQGWIKIIKQATPASSTQTFSFTTAASPAASISPSTLTLSHGQSQTLTIPLDPAGGVQNITVTEALSAGWEQTATIVCTSPSGGSATYVTVNNANRTIAAALDATNYGAICTISNFKQTRVRTRKTVANGDTGTFNLSAQTGFGTSLSTDQGNGGATAYQQSISGAVTLTESSGSNSSITKYITAVSCTNDDTGAAVVPTTSTLTGATRSVTLTPPANADTSCLFVNTRTAALSVIKTNGVSSLAAGSTASYAITLVNGGPSDADGSTFRDPVTTGLSCTSVSCTSAVGGAVCPSAGGVTPSALQGGGIALPTFPANSTVTFSVGCLVTATGS
ncbi:MAG: hypothetical protein AB7I35_20155 [Ramlibacter sp.]